MKKTRRIEITAFRRTTIVYQDQPEADQPERPATMPSLCPPKLAPPIKALVEAQGDSARAVRLLGLGRGGFIALLRALSLSIKPRSWVLLLSRGMWPRKKRTEESNSP